MIKIEMLRAFAEVARSGSLAAAAQALGRTPSALSMTLKQLEEHLGAPLFETERKNRLTALGRYTLEMATRELGHFDRTLAALADFAEGRAGEVRVAAVPSYATAVLPGLAGAFLAAHPGVRLDIHDLDSASILAALAGEQIDLGIASDTPPDPDFRREPLGKDAFGVVLRRDDPLAAQRRIAWSELAQGRFLSNPLCERIAVPGVGAALAAARLRVHNTTTLLAMVRAGNGVTVLPELVIRHGAPDIAFVPLEEPVPMRALHLVRRVRDTPNPAAAAFAAFVRARAGEIA